VPTASPLVLIVDDNAKNLKLAGDVLGAAGFRTLTAGSGEEAVALAVERRPDAILMDLRLPDMDGAEAARLLARDARTASIPVVALTATALERASTWLAEVGFAGHIEKPIDVETFPQSVRRHCRFTTG
jgi:two-component system cell cycle response regulator DivK